MKNYYQSINWPYWCTHKSLTKYLKTIIIMKARNQNAGITESLLKTFVGKTFVAQTRDSVLKFPLFDYQSYQLLRYPWFCNILVDYFCYTHLANPSDLLRVYFDRSHGDYDHEVFILKIEYFYEIEWIGRV